MRTYKNILIICLLLVTLVVNASTYVSTLETKNDAVRFGSKFSLKNISSFTHKTTTFYSLKSSLEFKGLSTNTKNNSNFLQFNKGNISYIIPYRQNKILTKFKAPTPQY
jgi:hypothetical protein